MSNLSDARKRLRTPVTRTPAPVAAGASSSERPVAKLIKKIWHILLDIVVQSIGGFLRWCATSASRLVREVAARRDFTTIPSILPGILRHIIIGRRRLIIAMCVIIISWWGFAVTRPRAQPYQTTQNTVSGTKAANGPVKENPSFKTILPTGKNIGELGGWNKISPPGKDPVYTYVDTIGRVSIQVSEQQLPSSFRADTSGNLGKLAEANNAHETIRAGDITAHIGTSTQGPQSVFLVKNDLLILIKSTDRIAEPLWQSYIKSLQ